MTEKINARGKAPFAVVSSSVTTGYVAEFSQSFAGGYEVVDLHRDTYGSFENEPAQGPFTETHVGGNQHRHAPLNRGTDTVLTRAEAFHINTGTPGEIRVYGPDFVDTAAPRASMLRSQTAKTPLNIGNIKTTTGSAVHGNYRFNYEVAQTSGRSLNNFYFRDNGGISRTEVISSYVLNLTESQLVERPRNESVIVERFNAPGGFDVSSRGVLDVEAEEFAANNALSYRNALVREALKQWLTAHTERFGTSSLDSGYANYHKGHRNTLKRLSGSTEVEEYDNAYITHELPRNDLSYAWITASAITTPYELGGHQRDGAYGNRNFAFTDIDFSLSSSVVSGGQVYNVDHIGINSLDKKYILSSRKGLLSRESGVLTFNGSNTYGELGGYFLKFDRESYFVSAWVKIHDFPTSGNNERIIQLPQTQYDKTGGPALATAGQYIDVVRDSSDGNGYFSFSGTTVKKIPLSLNRWYHIVFSINRSSGRNLFYVDGELLYDFSYEPDTTSAYLFSYALNVGARDNDPFGFDKFFSGSMCEISVYEGGITERYAKDLFKEMYNGLGKRPKSFLETSLYKIDNSLKAHYTGKIDKVYDSRNGYGIRIVDYLGNTHLPTFNMAVNSRPSISYSTYFNGPYHHPSWKQIRGGEHPVARKMRRENIVSVMDIPKDKEINTSAGRSIIRTRRANSSTNYKEPPVSIKYKPMVHDVLMKGTTDPLSGQRITHTYANNLAMLGNKALNKRLNTVKISDQVYDRINQFVGDPNLDEQSNPINKVLGFKYGEIVWPKEENTFLKDTRGRTQYFYDVPGYGTWGYDNNPSELYSLWAPTVADRDRTSPYPLDPYTTASLDTWGRPTIVLNPPPLNSQGVPISGSVSSSAGLTDFTASWGGRSRLPIDKIGKMHRVFSRESSGVRLLSPQYGGELNASYFYALVYTGTPGYQHVLESPQSLEQYQSNYYYSGDSKAITGSFLSARAKYCAFLDYYKSSPFDSDIYNQDSGINYEVADMAGKGPWFNSYDEYASDLRSIAKEYSLIPEFRISEHMPYYTGEAGGNFRKTNNKYLTITGGGIRDASAASEIAENDDGFYSKFAHSDLMAKTSEIKKAKDQKLNKVTLKCKGIKKLLPYNGFYPIERTLQLATLFSQSYASNVYGGLSGSNDELRGSLAGWGALLQPFYAPGIMYNTVKSGIAVEFPAYTEQLRFAGNGAGGLGYDLNQDFLGSGFGFNGSTAHYVLTSSANYSFPFESIIIPEIGIPQTGSGDIDKGKLWLTTVRGDDQGLDYDKPPWAKYDYNDVADPKYSLAASNFFGEIPAFFLRDNKFVAATSLPQSKWKNFEAGKSYYMDVALKKSSDLVMMEAHHDDYYETGRFGEKLHGRYFGWPISKYAGRSGLIYGGSSPRDAWTDPAYSPYTPPYFESEAILRMKFQPSQAGSYTLEEILANLTVENIFPDIKKYEDTLAYDAAMSVSASVQVFGKTRNKSIEYGNNSNPMAIKDSESNQNDIWVISPKMETPVLNFSNQELKKHDAVETYFEAVSGSGFGRGMWSGYGEIPTGSTGIYLEVRDSFQEVSGLTGSLLEQVGFVPTKEKIGQLAESKQFSEAIVAIPFLDNPNNLTTQIECHNFIKLDKKRLEVQRKNIANGDAAVKQGDFGSTKEIRETSISKMVEAMQKYVIPPRMNFLEYSDIDPFVMYIFEFNHTLDQQDLADIWQGVMPKIAMTAEKDEIEFSHPSGENEFFGGQELPDNLRWMIFKVKKKAEKNYFAVTADSTDDDRFQFDFQVGRKAPEYSYNWPYDFCSLVELAKVEIDLEYKNKETKTAIAQKAPGRVSGDTSRVNRRGGRRKFSSGKIVR